MNGWIYGIEGGDCLGKENFRKEKMYNLNSTPTHSQTIQWAPNFRLCIELIIAGLQKPSHPVNVELGLVFGNGPQL